MFRRFQVLQVLLALLVIASSPASWSADTPSGVESDLSLSDILGLVTTASKKAESIQDAPSVMQVITAKDIENYGAVILADVLDRITSSYMWGATIWPNAQVNLRGDPSTGGENPHVLILLNGRPIRESYALGYSANVYNTFPVHSLDRIEVIRGPGSVLYGTGAYAGVINLITKKVQGTQVYGKVGFGSNLSKLGAASASTELGDLKVSTDVQYLQANGYLVDQKDSNKVENNFLQAQNRLGVTLNATYKDLTFSGYYGSDYENAFSSNTIWPVAGALPYASWTDHALLDLGYAKKLVEGWNTTFNATANLANMRFFHPGNADDYSRGPSRDLIVEWTNFISLMPNLNLTVGGLVNWQNGVHVEPSTTLPGQTADVVNNVINNPFTSTPAWHDLWYSTYFQADYTPVSFLKLVAGGQVNWVTHLSADFVPRLGVVSNFADHWNAKLLYGEAFRSGAEDETHINGISIAGNPNLLPEKIRTTDLQLAYTEKEWQVALTLFQSYEFNRIAKIQKAAIGILGTLVTQSQNTGTLSIQGIELEGKAKVARDISVEGAYTYQSSVTDGGIYDAGALPRTMIKLGSIYQNSSGVSLGIYNLIYSNFMGSPNSPPSVNPTVNASDWVTVNLGLDVGKISGTKSLIGMKLNTYVWNLLYDGYTYRQLPSSTTLNTVVDRPGRGVLISLSYEM